MRNGIWYWPWRGQDTAKVGNVCHKWTPHLLAQILFPAIHSLFFLEYIENVIRLVKSLYSVRWTWQPQEQIQNDWSTVSLHIRAIGLDTWISAFSTIFPSCANQPHQIESFIWSPWSPLGVMHKFLKGQWLTYKMSHECVIWAPSRSSVWWVLL
jgi:hypothetical protein